MVRTTANTHIILILLWARITKQHNTVVILRPVVELHDFDVTVFLANVAGEAVYPMYDISGPASDATSSYDNKTFIYLQLEEHEAHTLYEVDSNYGLSSVIEWKTSTSMN